MKEEYSKEERMQYAENLSHELLTPLAVIRTKAELIMQSKHLGEEDLKNLDVILKSVDRMSRLNKALIILSKINNEIYVDRSDLNLNNIVQDSLDNFEDIIRKKQLQIRLQTSEVANLNSNHSLIEILVSNLLKNAVYHNVESGEIIISIGNNRLQVKNTTQKKLSENIYGRFISSGDDQSTFGLGLSIVKKICDYLGFSLSHHLENGYFTIEVDYSA